MPVSSVKMKCLNDADEHFIEIEDGGDDVRRDIGHAGEKVLTAENVTIKTEGEVTPDGNAIETTSMNPTPMKIGT